MERERSGSYRKQIRLVSIFFRFEQGEVLPAACKMMILVQSEPAIARFRQLFGATNGFDMALSLR